MTGNIRLEESIPAEGKVATGTKDGTKYGLDINVIGAILEAFKDVNGKYPGQDGYVRPLMQTALDALISNEALKVLQANLNSTDDSVDIPAPTTIGDGNKTVTTAGTAVQLSATSAECKYVVIEALLANTGLISVGGATTTPAGTVKGRVLAAGDPAVVEIDNLNKVYINSTVDSEGVSYYYGV